MGAWNRLSRRLAAKNETWKIWIEWFEFRFIGISGESVPSFLWGEVESRFVSDENKFNNDSITSCNQYFAQCALNVVEEFADFQSSAEQIAGGLQFEVGDDEQIRLSKNNSPHQGEETPSHANSIIDELLSLIGRMKIECQLNSATYLSESIDSYADAFGEKSWKDPAKVVVRGDSLRSLLNAQLNRLPGSDLPELQDKTILIFKNLVRTHNLLVNVYQELSTIDAGLSSNTINRSGDAVNALKKIINYADSKIALDKRAEASIKALIALGQSPDEADKVKIGISISNFAQATFSYLWKNRLSIISKSASLAGLSYGLAKWALANESWITGFFSVNSEVGALISATLRFLHQMPLL